MSILFILLGLLAFSQAKDIAAVLLASSPLPFHLQSWFHNQHGLILLSFPRDNFVNETISALSLAEFDELLKTARRPVFLQDGVEASFDDNGDLYYQKGDQKEEWVLKFRSHIPQPVAVNDEGVPSSVINRRIQRQLELLSERQKREDLIQKGLLKAPYRITVDPGHGGSDAGAVGQGYEEAFLNLDVGNRLRTLLLNDRGLWSVQSTRTTDIDVSLTARTNMANNWPADRFVSIHTNSFSSSSAQGTETFSYAEGGTAAKLRDRIQQEAIKAWGLVNRGSKTENFHVLRETTMPATLSEMGFITSPVDIKKLSDPNARQQMAAAHLYAIQYHFGVSLNLPVVDEN